MQFSMKRLLVIVLYAAFVVMVFKQPVLYFANNPESPFIKAFSIPFVHVPLLFGFDVSYPDLSPDEATSASGTAGFVIGLMISVGLHLICGGVLFAIASILWDWSDEQ